MEWLKILSLLALVAIFVQDMTTRSVYWLLFPLLTGSLLALRSAESAAVTGKAILVNYGFLLVQLSLVSVYFSLKRGRWVNITNDLLGWGDVLFLACIACYLSVLNFLFFYMTSLTLAVFFGLILQLRGDSKKQLLVNSNVLKIPLAGLQSLLFGLFLTLDWWNLHFDATSDNWLLKLISK